MDTWSTKPAVPVPRGASWKKGRAIDLLIVDYAMLGINGLQIIRQAGHQYPSLKTLLITGDAAAVHDGVVGVQLLRKPFAPAEFSQIVAEILAV